MQDRSARADTADVPGTLHQGILSLFRDDPWLAFDLLGLKRPVCGTPIDRRAEVERDAEQPWTIKLRYPDLVLVYRDPDDDERGVVICVEAQNKPDGRKRWRIPLYQAALADDHELPTWAVVVSFSARLSRDLETWRDGPPPKVDAMIIDVERVQPIGSFEQARGRPTAAVLVGALHGSVGNFEAARLGLRAARELPDKQRRRYAATILAALPERERSILIGELPVEEQDELWEIERRSGTYKVGLRAGLEQGREQGLEQGREQGRRQMLIEMILAILEVRGVTVDADSEARIRGGTSLEPLQCWARRAREVSRASQLFEQS